MERISDTIRNEIAVSAEKSYQSLSLKEAAEVFQIQNESQFNKFLDVEKEKGFDRGYNWTIDGNRLHFKPIQEAQSHLAFANGIPDMMGYAQELDKIV